MNIFEALRESHIIQKDLSEQLTHTSGDSPERRKIFNLLKNELFAHAIAEDRYFYIPLMMTDSGLNITRLALAEHHEMDEILQSLEQTDFSHSRWLVLAKRLSEIIAHHIHQEEHSFFQKALKILDENQKLILAKKYLSEYKKYKAKDIIRLVG
ncbi:MULTISPECIES: hemerythrin domain-containing protein [Acinetobacter]|uniref:hemerythrin domain-containing protein n=1 Tax=Acinetobacter TaxID=469 RepID=UPI0004D4967A|nr:MULTISPECIES: hemerythrin domain-containing protein [unclassified Acinetobacter]KEC82869.1 hemerythrin [Acinetobacter sp. ETR1]WEE39218.1 hemerythrin domain-containing protein [Acinetobacter sp. TAC-1]